MIYSIGYQRLTADDIAVLLYELHIHLLVDVRAKPVSRKPGFHRTSLTRRFGARYHWAGDMLGGPGSGGVHTQAGLDWLRGQHADGKRLMLMCCEHEPADCHRHSIAMDLMPDIVVHHVWEGGIYPAHEVQRWLEDEDYEPEAMPLDMVGPMVGNVEHGLTA